MSTRSPRFAFASSLGLLLALAAPANAANVNVYEYGGFLNVVARDAADTIIVEQLPDRIQFRSNGNTTFNGEPLLELAKFGLSDKLSIATKGGSDVVSLQNLSHFDVITVDLASTGTKGLDDDSLDLQNIDTDILEVTTGPGNDYIGAIHVNDFGTTTIDTGAGVDRINFGSTDSNAGFSVDTNTLFVVEAELVELHDLHATSIDILAGPFNDAITLERVTAVNHLDLFTGLSKDSVTLTDVTVYGDLAIDLGDTGDTNSHREFLTLTAVTVQGTTSLDHGRGVSSLTVDDSSLATLAITTGGTNGTNVALDDDVRILNSNVETLDAATGARNDTLYIDRTVLLTCLVDLGNGHDDFVWTNSHIVMRGGTFYLAIDGGNGTDTAAHDRTLPGESWYSNFEQIN